MNTPRTANLLGALACAIVERVESDLKSHPNQHSTWFAALNLIGCFGGCSNKQLGAALDLSHPATVRLVDKLEDERLVIRRPGDDRRAVALHLTPDGRARVHAILERRDDILQGLVEHLTDDQQHTLDGIVETLLTSMTDSPLASAHVCRFCDERACQQQRCPVHLQALRHQAAANSTHL